MKMNYDRATDTLLIVLTSRPIEETEEIRTGILADIDKSGSLVSLEILNASRNVEAFQELISSVNPVAVALEMQ